MKKKSNNYFFTLIEMMIVIIIIGIASSVTGLMIHKSISEYRYSRSVSGIIEKLKFAKQLAMVNQNDVCVCLKQDKEKVLCEIEFYGGNSMENSVKYRHVFSNVSFKYEIEKEGMVENFLPFFFSSTGDFSPKGILFFKPFNNSKNLKEIKVELKEHFSREFSFSL